MAKNFSITPEQRRYLAAAVNGAVSQREGKSVCPSMAKRGWLRRKPSLGVPTWEITDLGRTVARQLGIVAEGVKP